MVIPNTKISDELNDYKDCSELNKIINNNNVSWSNNRPFT